MQRQLAELSAALRDAQALASIVAPWKILVRIRLEFSDGDDTAFPVPAPNVVLPPPSPPPIAAEPPEWRASRVQRRILVSLRGGKRKLRKQLTNAPGIGTHFYDRPGGWPDLLERGLVAEDGDELYLTESGEVEAEAVRAP